VIFDSATRVACTALFALTFFSLTTFTFLYTTTAHADTVHWEITDGGNGHFYAVVIIGSPMVWADARTSAQGIGPSWDLATTTSAEQSVLVENLFSTTPSAFASTCVSSNCPGPWLGGFAVFGSTNFQWVRPRIQSTPQTESPRGCRRLWGALTLTEGANRNLHLA